MSPSMNPSTMKTTFAPIPAHGAASLQGTKARSVIGRVKRFKRACREKMHAWLHTTGAHTSKAKSVKIFKKLVSLKVIAGRRLANPSHKKPSRQYEVVMLKASIKNAEDALAKRLAMTAELTVLLEQWRAKRAALKAMISEGNYSLAADVDKLSSAHPRLPSELDPEGLSK